MILKTRNILLLMFLALALYACKQGHSIYEEDAKMRAMKAAQALIESDHNDTIQMERMILDAKAIQSEYVLAGDSLAAQAFDAAFKEYMQTHDAPLAQEIF